MNSHRSWHIAPSANYTININKQYPNSEVPSISKNNEKMPDVDAKEPNVYITDHSVKIVFTDDGPAEDYRTLETNDFNKMKKEIHRSIVDGEYDVAVKLTNTINNSVLAPDGLIKEIIQKLLESHSTAQNLMSFAFMLSISDSRKGVLRKHFPEAFQLIFGQEEVKIINQEYGQALKLDANADSMNDRQTWGDSKDKTSKRVSWKFLPIWENNEVTFRVYNIDCKQYLKLAVSADNDGDRNSYGSPNVDTDKHRFYVEPYMKNEELVFYLMNYKYKQGLKLVVAADGWGDRKAMGHNGDIYSDQGRFRWIISKW